MYNDFSECSVSHKPRVCNVVAHTLAAMGHWALTLMMVFCCDPSKASCKTLLRWCPATWRSLSLSVLVLVCDST